ncbi:MAG: hypothetical protein AAFX85_03850, partial [Pseudomonadota bacterium]
MSRATLNDTDARSTLLQHLRTRDGDGLAQTLRRHLATPAPLGQQLRTTGVLLALVLAAFLLRRPEAFQRGMWAQVMLHGLPITFLVNLAAGVAYRRYLAQRSPQSLRITLLILFGDAAARLTLLLALTAASFLWWT